MRILLTGFEPFGGQTVNPSQLVVELFGRRAGIASDAPIGDDESELSAAVPAAAAEAAIIPQGIELVTLILAVKHGAAARKLIERVDEVRPEFVLSLGQGRRRAGFAIERLVINRREFRMADNSGARPDDGPIAPGAPDAYFTTLPDERLLAALLEAGVPAERSLESSTFVCNEVCFSLLHAIYSDASRAGATIDATMGIVGERKPRPVRVRAGFIHIPLLPEQLAKLNSPTAPSSPISATGATSPTGRATNTNSTITNAAEAPPPPSAPAVACMTLETMTRGVAAILAALASEPQQP